MIDYKKLSGRSTSSEIIPGTTKRFFWASFNDILVCPRAAGLGSATTFSEMVDITDDITFDVDKGFVQIYQTRDSGSFKFESKGERDMSGMGGTYTFKYPGTDSEALGMMRQLRNDQGVILAEMVNGRLMLLGSERFPIEPKVSFMSGKNESEYLGLEVVFDVFESYLQIYKGTVTMSAIGGTYTEPVS